MLCNDTIVIAFFILHILSLFPRGFNWPMPPAIPDDEYLGILNPPPPPIPDDAPPPRDPTAPPIPELAPPYL